MINTNKANVIGTILQPIKLSHTLEYEDDYSVDIYSTVLAISRKSGKTDLIPIEFEATRGMLEDFNIGDKVYVMGDVRTYNIDGHLKIIIFAKNITKVYYNWDVNIVELTGRICKPPIFRITPSGKHVICDLFIEVLGKYDKLHHVPCIVWGRNAKFASKLNVGAMIRLEGAIQSRDYLKRIDNEILEKTALEVSCIRIERLL